jgi:aspartate-semialdehyde dehydrogenase
VFVELACPATRDEARDVLSTASGVRVVDDASEQRYPTPRNVAGTDDVQVGRIRVDHGRRDGLALFFSADNLRRGAATNAVQVAELLLGG